MIFEYTISDVVHRTAIRIMFTNMCDCAGCVAITDTEFPGGTCMPGNLPCCGGCALWANSDGGGGYVCGKYSAHSVPTVGTRSEGPTMMMARPTVALAKPLLINNALRLRMA